MATAFETADKLLTKMPADFADFQAGLAQGFNFKGLDNQFTDFIQNLQRTGLATTEWGANLIDAVQTAQDKLDVFLAHNSLDLEMQKADAALDSLNTKIEKLDGISLAQATQQLDLFSKSSAKALDASLIDPYYAALTKLGVEADGTTKKMSREDFMDFSYRHEQQLQSLDDH